MKKKKIISLLLVFALLLAIVTGCGGNDKDTANNSTDNAESGARGRFIESEISLPEGIDSICTIKKLSDGSLMAVGKNSETDTYFTMQTSNLGVNWNTAEVKGLSGSDYPLIAVNQDKSVAFIPYASDNDLTIEISNEQGEVSSVSLTLPGDSGNQLYQADFDSQGNLLARDLEFSLLKIDLSDGTCSQPFDTSGTRINYFGLVGTKCIVLQDDGVLVFDTVSGEKTSGLSALEAHVKENDRLKTVSTDYGCPMVFAEGTEENSIVFANFKGMFYMTESGSVAEQLIDGSYTSLGDTSANFFAMAMMDAAHLIVCAADGNGTNLYLYSYDEETAAVPDKELNVYALDESDVLRQAVSVYQKQHPDVYVNLTIGMSGEDGVTLEDALSVLNTDIMAGKGPDVMILDGMPMDSYIEKGILEDISDVVDAADQEDGLFDNIVNGSKKDGKIYAMPARFLIPMAGGDDDTVNAAGDLKTLADRAEALKTSKSSKNVMPAKGTQGLLRDLFYADSATWVQEDGTLDEKALENYLTQAKRIYDVDGYSSTDDLTASFGDGTAWGTKVGSFNNTGYMSGDISIPLGTLDSIESYQTIKSAQAVAGDSCCIFNHQNVRSYIPYLQAGVTSDGNTELAKEFVKILLGKDLSSDANGIPVNQAAFEQQMAAAMEETDLSMVFSRNDGSEAPVELDIIPLTEQDADAFRTMAESLEAPSLSDRVIQNLVLEQGEKYLLGEQSLADTVSATLKKVNLYLSE